MPSENRGTAKPKSPPARRPAAPRKRPASRARSGRPPGRPVYELRQGNTTGKWAAGLGIVAIAAIGTGAGVYSSHRWHPRIPSVLSHLTGPKHFVRPYGMAPVAFGAYVRACAQAGIDPDRITQTIGDGPRSAGFHHRDGTVKQGQSRVDFTAAVDLEAHDLSGAQRDRLQHDLTEQGFASWYRGEGKWRGHEHVHAIYALLPMKPQLREQVKSFLEMRRRDHVKPLRWERAVSHRLASD